ncbi:unnamed protein product [Penicillium egyptiacum]|uniref:Uncharacterized protein n=1 Tax=Penicillium egyptiacum TaxID=1303716 RepID=A0A9W4K8V3_9EURO|nr:unnamed protein product [Penicillium egyptiacum]
MSERYKFRCSTHVQQLPPQQPGGSLQDATPRTTLKIEDLDLAKSYVGTLVPRRQPLRPKKSRPWAKWTGAMPLIHPAQLPRGWHMNEDDLEIDGPGDESSYAAITIGPCRIPRGLNGIKLALRVPGVSWSAELDFICGTGSNMMSIYEGDLDTLLGPFGATVGPSIPVIGIGTVNTGGGIVTKQYMEMEVTILDGNRERMTAWTRTICALNSADWIPSAVPRLDGPIVRDLLYTGSAPDGSHLIHISTTRSELALPQLDLANNPPQHNSKN